MALAQIITTYSDDGTMICVGRFPCGRNVYPVQITYTDGELMSYNQFHKGSPAHLAESLADDHNQR